MIIDPTVLLNLSKAWTIARVAVLQHNYKIMNHQHLQGMNREVSKPETHPMTGKVMKNEIDSINLALPSNVRTEGASLLRFDSMTVMSFAKLEDSLKMVAGRECMF